MEGAESGENKSKKKRRQCYLKEERNSTGPEGNS
jgi:hypothetical protein